MASRQIATLTIPNGGTQSNAIELRNVREFSIQAPAVLTGSVNLQSGSDAAGNNLTVVQSPPGTDVAITANRTTVFTVSPFPSIAVVSNGAEAAARVFTVVLVIGE